LDGEFWNGYDWEKRKEHFKTNRGFWLPKIERNMQRDRMLNRQLQEAGITVIRFWQNEIQRNLGACVHSILGLVAERQ
jgi:DNA mismatch endonuclease (patch repair protein)